MTAFIPQSTIQAQIQRELLINHGISTNDRRAALEVARSLQSQLFFYEVEWGGRALTDGVEDVYMFLDDQEGGSDARIEMEELPTGVVTYLTKCYTPCCVDGHPCYAYSCPRRVSTTLTPGDSMIRSGNFYCGIRAILRPSYRRLQSRHRPQEWYVLATTLQALTGTTDLVYPFRVSSGKKGSLQKSLRRFRKAKSDVKRTALDAGVKFVAKFWTSRIIRKVISKEQQYIKDLDFIEEVCCGSSSVSGDH